MRQASIWTNAELIYSNGILGHNHFIFTARRPVAYTVHQDLLLVDSLENTNIHTQHSQCQRHTSNINQICSDLTFYIECTCMKRMISIMHFCATAINTTWSCGDWMEATKTAVGQPKIRGVIWCYMICPCLTDRVAFTISLFCQNIFCVSMILVKL